MRASTTALWTGELSLVLADYECSREQYPVLERFMLRLSDLLQEASFAPREMPARYEIPAADSCRG